MPLLVFDGTSDGTQSSKINTSVLCGAVGKKTGCGKYGSTVTKQYAGSRGAVVGYSYNAIETFTGVGAVAWVRVRTEPIYADEDANRKVACLSCALRKTSMS